MIIKKIYIQNTQKEEVKEEENILEDVVLQDEAIEEPEEQVNEKEPEKADIDELDLAAENIKFEQREERREGTRRRGYRRTQDRNLLSRAQQEAISIKKASRQEGYDEGINQALSDIKDIRKKIGEFYTYKEEIINKVSECIYDVAVEVAKKIIKSEIESNKEVTINIIKEIVSDINKSENKIILHVKPQDVELVKDGLPEIFSESFGEAKIMVIPDKAVKEGGVIVETSNGIIDASVETQLIIMEKALKTANTENE